MNKQIVDDPVLTRSCAALISERTGKIAKTHEGVNSQASLDDRVGPTGGPGFGPHDAFGTRMASATQVYFVVILKTVPQPLPAQSAALPPYCVVP
jgi:hypothetical protein